MRQTPRTSGWWEDVYFTYDSRQKCDYVVILNRVPEKTEVSCPPDNIWALMQEPPNEYFKRMHQGPHECRRVYTQDTDLNGDRYTQSQPALPWHINKTFDDLVNGQPPYKTRDLSCITSNITVFDGHRERLKFIERIIREVKLNLYGRGFSYIDDKWFALALIATRS